MTTLSLLKSRDEFTNLKLRPLFDGRYQRYPINREGNKWFTDGLTKWFKGFADYNETVDYWSARFCQYAYGDHLAATITDQKSAVTRERLLNAGKYLLIIFQMDLAMEKSRTLKSDPLMRQLMDKLVAIVETGRCDDPNFSYGLILLDTINSLDVSMDDYQKLHLRRDLINVFQKQYEIHSNYYLKNQFIPFEEYVKQRLQETGWLVYISLVEYCINYSPPDVIRNNDIVVKFYKTVTTLALAVDDYLCLIKKLATNDLTNGILSYAFSHKCTIQSAIDYYYQYIHELDTECQSLIKAAAEHPVLSKDIHVAKMMVGALNVCYYFNAFMFENCDLKVKNGLVWCQKWDKLNEQVINKTQMSSNSWPLL